MKRLFPAPTLADFGPNYLHSRTAPPALEHIAGSRSAVLRDKVREQAPKRPGVYGMLDAHGEVIYIGKAKELRARLMSYFRPRSRDPKAGRIVRHTKAIVCEINPSEFAALHRELELIRRWRPRFNVQGLPNSRRPIYVCIGRQPAPYVYLSGQPPRNVNVFFGPVTNSVRLREAVRWLNDYYRLRDCPQSQTMHFAEQGELFPVELSPGCLRYEIGTCLGPCTAGCSRGEYFEQVRAVETFLDGSDVSLLDRVHQEMQEASQQHQFERAASLRDKWTALTSLHDQLTLMRQWRREASFIYPLTGHDDKTLWYMIHDGRTIVATPEPRDEVSRYRTALLIEAVYQTQTALTGKQYLAQRDSILLVASWFRKHPEERAKTMTPAEALA